MKLLNDYIFDDRLRYEGHKLVYTPEGKAPVIFGGILAASVMATLLSVTDEGETRGIELDTPQGRNDFFVRYEKEMIADNGGLFETEVQTLNEAYMEFAGDEEMLACICRNDRLLDLAIGLTVEYMQRLVREQIGEQIYDQVQWEGPFAKWLLNAGYVETRRQYLLSIDWLDSASVYALAEELPPNPSPETHNPLFVFDGLSAEQVLNGYWTWLWTETQKEANLYPDAKVRLAEYKQTILEKETHYDDLKPEMKDFTPEQLNLFRKWMNLWIDFVKHKITMPEESFPEQHKNPRIQQELFPDKYQTCPEPDHYASTRDYIMERCRYDAAFKKFILSHTIAELCDQLTLMFGWYVVPNHLSKRFKKAQVS